MNFLEERIVKDGIIKEGNVPLDERIEKISLDRLASRSVDVVPYVKRMAESESTTE